MPLLKGGTTAMLGIPKTFTYGIIPVFMSLTAIRVIQNIYRLSKETEQTLGASVPTIDVDKLEQEYLDQVAAEKKEEEGSK
jgi:TRAP-type C4-dicarboxylate transport system permease small subunit